MTLGGRPNRKAINAMLGQAVQLQRAGRHGDAASIYRTVLLHEPRNFDATHLLGVATIALGDAERAIPLLQRAIDLDPRSGEAWNHLGNAFKFLVRIDEAMAAYRKAMEVNPKLITAHHNLGMLQKMTGDFKAAKVTYEKLYAARKDYVPALLALGEIYLEYSSNSDARRMFRDALSLQPGNQIALDNLVKIDGEEAAWDRLSEYKSQFVANSRQGGFGEPFTYLSITDDPHVHLSAAIEASRPQGLGEPFAARNPHNRRRIRIGYLSTDYREHPISFLIPELIELHQRTLFEVTGYSAGRDDGTSFRRRLASAFDRFVDVSKLSALQLARTIYDDEIDILIDLNGHTKGTRMPLMELRPAPIQLSWLGYPATIGAPYIDYAFVDRFVVPSGSEKHFSEQLVFLPDSFQVNDRKRPVDPAPPPRAAYGLRDDALVLCCFNNSYKIHPEVFDAWTRMLNDIPNSVLWLYAKIDPVRVNLTREAQKRGIDPARILFAPRDPYPTYLARYRHADLVLDTWPYNAGTTASDALWMGAPVLTLAQRSMTSRMAGSFLTALDLPDLITTTVDDYVATAVRLAREPDALAGVRARLAKSRDHGRFFDTDRFRRHMEAALLTMWERHKAGLPPQSFAVPDQS